MRKIIFAIALGLACFGCSTNLKIAPVLHETQTSFYKDGAEVLVSPKESLVIVQLLKGQFSSLERMTFVIAVENATDAPFTFSHENVVVSVDENNLKVFSYEELIAEVEAQRRAMAFVAGLNALNRQMLAHQAGYQYHYGSVNTKHYDQLGYMGCSSGTYAGYTYDPNAALQAQLSANAQTLNDVAMIRNYAETRLGELQNTILKKETIFPGNFYGGYVQVEPPPVPQ